MFFKHTGNYIYRYVFILCLCFPKLKCISLKSDQIHVHIKHGFGFQELWSLCLRTISKMTLQIVRGQIALAVSWWVKRKKQWFLSWVVWGLVFGVEGDGFWIQICIRISIFSLKQFFQLNLLTIVRLKFLHLCN